MNCDESVTKMMDYLEGNLSQHEVEQLEKHLASCERCMDEVREYQTILKDIANTEMETPDESLRINFYHMLHSEIEKQKKTIEPTKVLRMNFPYSKVAAGLALLVAGTFIGMVLNPLLKHDNQNSELTQLKTEVQSMKEVVMMNMLNEESPSDRIKAVNYAEEIPSPNDQVIEALVKTLNTDKNVNVRMAAAYSLSKFSNRQIVVDSLVKSLEKQTDPTIQIVLMDILVQKREASAVRPMQKIMSSDKTIKEVKDIAKKNIQILL